MKEKLYWALDGILTTLWPRIQAYRDLGVPLQAQRQAAVAALELSDIAREYVARKETDAGFTAYWEVCAQFTIIHADAIGFNPHSDEVQTAAKQAGRVFQWMKAADDCVDQEGTKRQAALSELYDIIIGTKGPQTDAEHYVKKEWEKFPREMQQCLRQVYTLEHRILSAATDKDRMDARGEFGRVAAEIYIKTYERNGLELSDNDKKFLQEESAAASYLDDFKDFSLDRQAGHGYREEVTRQKLRNLWLIGMYKAQTYLTLRQKMRHYAFLALGGLYQMREIIGIKART